jgi:hypothetical protein
LLDANKEVGLEIHERTKYVRFEVFTAVRRRMMMMMMIWVLARQN